MAHFLCHLGCSHFGALLLDFYFTENNPALFLQYIAKGKGVFEEKSRCASKALFTPRTTRPEKSNQRYNQVEDNPQHQQPQVGQSISAKEAGNQTPYVCGFLDFQKLNGPVQQHYQTEKNVHTPETADDEMPEQSEQFTYVYAGTPGTDGKLIPVPIKAALWQLVAP